MRWIRDLDEDPHGDVLAGRVDLPWTRRDCHRVRVAFVPMYNWRECLHRRARKNHCA